MREEEGSKKEEFKDQLIVFVSAIMTKFLVLLKIELVNNSLRRIRLIFTLSSKI
jgi:hypothetical protein